MDFGTCFKLWVLNGSGKKKFLKSDSYKTIDKSIELFIGVSSIIFISIIHVKKIEFTLMVSPQETPIVIP